MTNGPARFVTFEEGCRVPPPPKVAVITSSTLIRLARNSDTDIGGRECALQTRMERATRNTGSAARRPEKWDTRGAETERRTAVRRQALKCNTNRKRNTETKVGTRSDGNRSSAAEVEIDVRSSASPCHGKTGELEARDGEQG